MAREKTLARRERPETEMIEPWDTFREMERMMRNVFTSPISLMRPSRWWMAPLAGEFAPEVDLRETENEFVLSATVPGLTKDDIDINVTNDSITISGERKTEEEKPGQRYHVRQQSYGAFSVSYALPSDVKPDEVKAAYKNGILEVTMPKAEVTKAHKVNVEAKD